jgi:AcrR family transcriptional regulator
VAEVVTPLCELAVIAVLPLERFEVSRTKPLEARTVIRTPSLPKSAVVSGESLDAYRTFQTAVDAILDRVVSPIAASAVCHNPKIDRRGIASKTQPRTRATTRTRRPALALSTSSSSPKNDLANKSPFHKPNSNQFGKKSLFDVRGYLGPEPACKWVITLTIPYAEGRMPQRKRRPRTTPDFAAIEELTANLLATHGESGLRIEELQRATGVSKSSLYGKYGGRDGLVAAGLMVLYERHYRETIGVIDEVVRTAQSRDELMKRFRQLTHYVANQQRTTERLHRAAVLAGTIARPELRAKVVALQSAMMEDLARSIDLARIRGFAKEGHSSRVLANFISALTFGRIIVAFDNNLPADELEQWTDAAMEMFSELLFAD